MKFNIVAILVLLFANATGCGISDSASTKQSKSYPAAVPSEESLSAQAARIESGRILAAQHCSTCHLLPDPSDLPSDRWPFVIEWMGHYLGHETFDDVSLSIVLQTKIPKLKKVTQQELEAIEYYFKSTSSSELASEQIMSSNLAISNQFQVRGFAQIPYGQLVSCVKIDVERERVFLANATGKCLNEYSFAEELLNYIPTNDTQVVGLSLRSDGFVATLIGDLFQRIDSGSIVNGIQSEFSSIYNLDNVIKNYFRIAHCCVADLNGDGVDDYLVSGFGASDFGAFSLLLTPKEGITWDRQVKRIDLISHNGAICSQTYDFDQDGDLDILALTAQGHHDMWYFENDLNESGRFITSRVWKHHPSYGANSFQLADLDQDGVPEIIVACGNNMELLHPPTRPYHGIRIYQNKGNMSYEEVFFQALPGAIQVTVNDFNGDGLVDIAAISNQPDWRLEKPISFLMLENQGDLTFASSTLSELKGTQWLSIDSADLDSDGDVDIVVGGMNMVPELKPGELENFRKALPKQPSVLVLENQLR